MVVTSREGPQSGPGPQMRKATGLGTLPSWKHKCESCHVIATSLRHATSSHKAAHVCDFHMRNFAQGSKHTICSYQPLLVTGMESVDIDATFS